MNTSDSKQKTIELAYLILRLTMGANMFVHGIVRIPKLDSFNIWMVEYFQDTFLPDFLVSLLAYSIPFVELAVGIFLIVGLFTRQALLIGALLMAILVFGSCLKENWEWAAFQMIYALFFFTLSYLIELNKFSIDSIRCKSSANKDEK
ncbi:DoxX family protein [Poseidonibacter lekithochrous]|uniref:DoxX family protein n=1 Tax=Poseidonibacter lekithochrous TaxID=1904463 RepID=UPI0008FC86FB|nr:DoxX family protein [Poseidonibacter lekithochrous]QKJ23630.1 DoxX family protein [Poseidonibacter lekithochrous]